MSQVLTADASKAVLSTYGITNDEVADLVSKYGDSILTILVQALKGGLSWSLIIEVIRNFGPVVLELLSSLFSKKQNLLSSGLTADAAQVVLDSSIFEVIVEKLLPQLLEKYGPQLVDLVMEAVMKLLKNKLLSE